MICKSTIKRLFRQRIVLTTFDDKNEFLTFCTTQSKFFAERKRYNASMRTRTLNARKRSFDFADFKPSVKTAITVSAQWLAIFLFASVDKFGYALSLAFVCGLVFARQNVLVLAPCFIIANCTFVLSWFMLLYTCVPVLLLFGLYALFFKLKKNVPLWSVAIVALVGMIPYAVCSCLFEKDYLFVGISLIVTAVFTFCQGISAYAVFVRGAFHKATIDEKICSAVVLCATGYALAGVGGYGFYAYHAVLAFGILACSMCFKPSVTLLYGVLMGLGATIKFGGAEWMGVAVATAAVAVAFSPFTKWSSALAMLAIEGIWWLLSVYSGAGWQSLITVAVGIIACLCIPKSAIAKVKSRTASDNRHAYAGVVNRRSREIAFRLSSASDVFYDMSKNLEKIAQSTSDCSPEKLAKEVARNFCGKCRERESCFGALGSDTSSVIQPMADAALNRGRVTILDMPPFVTGRCANMHSLASVINSTAQAYKQRVSEAQNLALCKSMMAEQFAGVSLVLDSLATESAGQINFANDGVEMLKSDLLKHNIVANEVVISGSGNDMKVTMTVRANDAQKAVLPRIVSRNLHANIEVEKVAERGDGRLVYLAVAPCFEVAYGIAQKRYDDEACGDTISVLCPSRNSRLFAICDGMGHGKEASEASGNAVNMIESFYRAGIESSITLSLVNKLLKLSFDDVFSTLDIAVVDMQSGGLDVVKLGSASSFIIRKENIEMLSCACAPMGILDNVESITSRYQLYDGDMLLMMSDGVFDVLESSGIAEMIDNLSTQNPQTLADEILKKALENGANDDCTVLALRLFAV